jgi:hypothetical protein
MENITEIHQRLYGYLMERYKKDNSFRFILRTTNHGGKLDKGYWFLGNENDLTFSFWKPSNIAYVIAHDGKSSLELTTHTMHLDAFFSK